MADSAQRLKTFKWTLRLVEARPSAPAGEKEPFTLGGGRHRIGADPSNDVHLDVRGVSRFHAAIVCHHDHCELEDLQSKNGTTVNGRSIQREKVAAGDELGFASVRAILQLLPAGDDELAFELSSIPNVPGTTRRGTVASENGGEQMSLALFACLRELEERFRDRAEPDYAGAAEVLVRHLGASGVQVLEKPPNLPLQILASVGQAPRLPAAESWSAAPTVDGDQRFRYLRLAEGGLAATRIDGHGFLFGLALAGAAGTTVSPAQLAICLLPFGAPPEAVAGPAERTSGAGLELPPEIVGGGSPAMKDVYRQIVLVAPSAVPVLVLGETGVGKEHLARALHRQSPRADKNFVAVNCAAIPAELLEAEMFGIGHGVATGVKARRGRFLEAHLGTLFLDEIGDLPLPLQAKLLRVLQEREVTPIGEKPVAVDVRVVAASHMDFAAAIAERRFREDLYYRLAGYVLQVPPLRERLDDLPALLGRFLQDMAREAGRPVRGVTVKAIEELRRQRWPGNVRQLQQVARRLVYLCPRGQAIDSRLVAEALASLPAAAPAAERNEFRLGEQSLEDYLGELEKGILMRALEQKEGNRTRAAALLGISRNGLARRLERYGLDAGQDEETG